MQAKIVRNSAWNEWIVKVYDDNGRRLPECDYHTDDKQDAIDTMAAMLKGK